MRGGYVPSVNRLLFLMNACTAFDNSIFWAWFFLVSLQGRNQDFKLGGAHFKKLRRAEGGAKIFGVFRVKNHRFTQKKITFFPNLGGSAPGARPPPPLPGSAPDLGVAGCRILLLPPPPGLQ